MPFTLSQTQRLALESDGFTRVENVLSSEELRRLDEHMTRKIAALPPGKRPEHMDLAHEHDPYLLEVCSHRNILDVIESVIGQDIVLFSSHAISKPPRTGMGVPWHQDSFYWPLEPMNVVSVWLAVDRSDSENGCMRVIPGSHRRGELPHEKMERPTVLDQELSRKRFEPSKAVDVCLEAGSMSLHVPHLIHGSNPNLSDRRRCGYTMRFMPQSVRFDAKLRPGFPASWPMFLVRGADRFGHNRYASA